MANTPGSGHAETPRLVSRRRLLGLGTAAAAGTGVLGGAWPALAEAQTSPALGDYHPIYNIQDAPYGALSDASSDATAAIQAALDAAAVTGELYTHRLGDPAPE